MIVLAIGAETPARATTKVSHLAARLEAEPYVLSTKDTIWLLVNILWVLVPLPAMRSDRGDLFVPI